MISSELRTKWRQAAEKICLEAEDGKLHKSTATRVLGKIAQEFNRMDDNEFLLPENEKDIYVFLGSLSQKETRKFPEKDRIIGYLKEALPVIRTQQSPSEHDLK